MEYILYWINQTKETFQDTCRIDAMVQVGKNGHFNFPKWYVMSLSKIDKAL